jgi:hypothetical protein
MILRIAMTNDSAGERAWDIATVFVALGAVYPLPNALNRFAYSKREVLFAM